MLDRSCRELGACSAVKFLAMDNMLREGEHNQFRMKDEAKQLFIRCEGKMAVFFLSYTGLYLDARICL